MTGHVSSASRVRRVTELAPPLWINLHPNAWVLSLRWYVNLFFTDVHMRNNYRPNRAYASQKGDIIGSNLWYTANYHTDIWANYLSLLWLQFDSKHTNHGICVWEPLIRFLSQPPKWSTVFESYLITRFTKMHNFEVWSIVFSQVFSN